MVEPSKSTESQGSFFTKFFRKARADKHASKSAHKADAPPPYVKTSPVIQSPVDEESIHQTRTLEASISPTSLATTPSLRVLPHSTSKGHARSRSRDRRLEPQGLHVVHEPKEQRIADIIFVHGLGGSSISTWSKDQDGALFWPEQLLARESGLSNARILTFGYTAFYWDTNASGSLSITDFARSLLAGLKNEPELSFGKVPIIFVAHSLGGLVVKKAYVLGRFNDTFNDIISSMSAMVFLGTPHHGSNLAKSLNRLLAVSIIGPSPKQYVADLDENSTAIEDLNEQFRNVPSELQIASFYETRFTVIGLKKLMIVDKKSSVIGCRGEVPQPIDADHHNLCKFDGPEDSNYVRVRNVLQSILAPLVNTAQPTTGSISKDIEKISRLLNVSKPPEDDRAFYFDRWMPETCSWILSKSSQFTKWVMSAQESQVLWINGPPGTGKSVIASYLISHFRELGSTNAFYFFRSGDQVQKSIASFIRSIALQIAQQSSSYREKLLQLSDAGERLQKNDAKLLWQKLISSTLHQIASSPRMYVVVDGLDESDAPQLLLSLLSTTPTLPLRIILLSRPTHGISNALNKFSNSLPVTRMSIDSSMDDIALFVESELASMHASNDLKRKVIDEIIERASGSFLWVHLAVKEVLNCHTQDEVEQALQGIPNDMRPLYKRMEDVMTETLKASDQKLAKAVLTWVSSARRVLTLRELSEALEPEYGCILDLGRTINQICGSLLVIDRKSRVTFVHQTAREYLTKSSTGYFAVARDKSNEQLFLRCMACLCDSSLRTQIIKSDPPALLSYATASWHFHLRSVSAASGEVFAALTTFLEESAVLTWIQTLAAENQLTTLVRSSQSLVAFLDRRRVYDASIAPNLRPLESIEVMELWATDLIKIVGKFGRNLLDMPESIHRFIPQFCPKESAIHRKFGRKGAFSVHVPGESYSGWDDSLARMFVGAEALAIKCAGPYFIVLTSTNSIILWSAETFQEIRRFSHQERVYRFCANQDGRLIASCGSRTTKVWDTETGFEILSIENPEHIRALDLVFGNQSAQLIISSMDNTVWRLLIKDAESAWEVTDFRGLRDQMVPSGNASSSPYSTALSPDGSQLAMGFRGAPLSIWALDGPELLARCRREKSNQTSFNGQPWSPVDKVIWRPHGTEVVGIYMGGSIFKWDPLEDASQEVDAAASTVSCNNDGDLIASGDPNGTVKIWKFSDFTLVYQLRYEYPVAAIAFSPDSRRFYDLRGPFCNVWEPNVLVRLSDFERSGSETSSELASIAVSTTMSETEVEVEEPITAIATGSFGQAYIVGNAEGTVTLLQNLGEKQTEIWSPHTFMPVEHLSCSADGKLIAIHDLSGRIIVKEIDPMSPSQPSSRPLLDTTVSAQGEPIQQILLSPDSEFILIASPASAQLFSVTRAGRPKEWKPDDPKTTLKWLNDPIHTDRLLAIGADNVFAYAWSDFGLITQYKVDLHKLHSNDSRPASKAMQIRRPSDPSLVLDQSGTIIEQAILAQDKRHIVLELAHFRTSASGSERELVIIPITAIQDTEEQQQQKQQQPQQHNTLSQPDVASSTPLKTIKPLSLSQTLLSQIQLPLGVLAGGKFVFLDNQNWICSWQLHARDEARALKRYFFLPRDWLNADCLELCRVLENGVLLIPRHGVVAAVRSDLSLQW